jgi:hypothetical protein
MNSFFDCLIPDYKPASTQSLTKQANKLLPRRKTRRAKKKKPAKTTQWQQEFDKAMKLHKAMKKQRAQQFRDFERLIAD